MKRFEDAAAGVEAGKISGAVGTFANTPPFVQVMYVISWVFIQLIFQHRFYSVTVMRNTFATLAL